MVLTEDLSILLLFNSFRNRICFFPAGSYGLPMSADIERIDNREQNNHFHNYKPITPYRA